jgi:hypothetical protein
VFSNEIEQFQVMNVHRTESNNAILIPHG